MANGYTPPVPDLIIQNFRVFKELTVPHMGQVNLFVGKNNVGKTTILEALQLWNTFASPSVLAQLTESRDETYLSKSEGLSLRAVSSLFHAREYSPVERLRIGPRQNAMSIEVLSETLPSADVATLHPYPLISLPVLLATRGNQRRPIRIGTPLSEEPPFRSSLPETPVTFVPAVSFTKDQLARMWDAVVLSSEEDKVVAGLQVIVPDIERVSFVAGDERHRIPLARVRGLNSAVPLRSLGDGVNRLLGLLVALVSASSGVLLVDEFENGLHYSIQHEVWRALIEMAARLNVQIVATTHSWDCVTAFQQASAERMDVEGVLIRLEAHDGIVRAIQFDEADLGIAAEHEIEVR